MIEKCIYCDSKKIIKFYDLKLFSIDQQIVTICCKNCGYQRIRRFNLYEYIFL
jgi:transcription elongation factor Elf1